MGNQQSSPNLRFYGVAKHPIDGDVTVYAVVGEGSFVMCKMTATDEQLFSLYNKINQIGCDKLITFYNYEVKKTFLTGCKQKIDDTYEPRSQLYWEFLNHDLNDEIKRVKQKQISKVDESFIWTVLEAGAEAAATLESQNIYFEFKPKFIQFTPGRQPKIYWAQIESKNMHRSYLKYFYCKEYRHALFAPQELYSLKIGTPYNKINASKCVVYSLGMTILQFATGFNVKKLYLYTEKQIIEKDKNELLEIIKTKYSQFFYDIMKQMLEPVTSKRMDLKELMISIRMYRKIEKEKELSDGLTEENIKNSKVSLRTS